MAGIEALLKAIDDTLHNEKVVTPGGKGETGLLGAIHFAHWQAPEHGNISEYAWNVAFKAAQLAIALANSLAQEKISNKQLDLAEKWYSHANYKWNRFKKGYMPLEKKLINEAKTLEKPKLNCSDAERRAKNSTHGAYNIMSRFVEWKSKAYCLCMDEELHDDLRLRESTMLVDSQNYNYDDDRWFRDFKDDQRWNRRSNILNLGRNNTAFAKGYGELASRIYGAVGQQFNNIASGAMYALGYYGARNDTYMPHTYLGTGGQGTTGSIVNIGVPGSVNPNALNPSGGG